MRARNIGAMTAAHRFGIGVGNKSGSKALCSSTCINIFCVVSRVWNFLSNVSAKMVAVCLASKNNSDPVALTGMLNVWICCPRAAKLLTTKISICFMYLPVCSRLLYKCAMVLHYYCSALLCQSPFYVGTLCVMLATHRFFAVGWKLWQYRFPHCHMFLLKIPVCDAQQVLGHHL